MRAFASHEPPIRIFVRLAWLVVVLVVVGSRLRAHPLEELVLAVAVASWLAWIAAGRQRRSAASVAALVVLGVSSGAVSIWSSVAIGFLAAVGVAAGTQLELQRALAVAACGPVALAVLVESTHRSSWLALAGAAAALGGLVGGVSRRQTVERSAQAARIALAREVHDVLAHTLGAVAVQLEAAAAVHESGGPPEKLTQLLQRSRTLVSEGLYETSRAARALRDEPVDLDERLRALVADEGVELEVRGDPRPLAPDAGLALYRAAQEAITNARKHAPGAPARIVLDFRERATVLTVENDAAASTPASRTGAGLGLQGMRERLELAGGTLDAGASASGWTVRATVPA